ncbi:glycosylhydrolase-like jelly roll fold domain-containing protein [Rhizohabitans arisaemae]|uniref:glycosylhydrolase-like jelly roll fold domain-containing protein n=1 Tax=Rhizohabitans arisaemae TaxID=2720610 RepID=UPI0024B1BCB6|nr:glycosylhydrolase-like jelly roll fold domain-containing protein [Rhizohabitans arisaemae]
MTVPDTVADLRAVFAEPGPEFSLTPFLRINDRVDPARLRALLRAMAEQGVRACHLFPERADWPFLQQSGIADPDMTDNGMPYGYLGPDWAELARTVQAEARAAGVELWVYDDADWPSGLAGGAVIENPDQVSRYVTVERRRIAGPAEIELGADGVCAAAYPPGEAGAAVSAWDTLTVPAGDWEVRIVRSHPGSGYWTERFPDLTSPEATEDFCRRTHDWYETELGGGIKGYFTDEPSSSPTLLKMGDAFAFAPALPYSTGLEKEFADVKGYDLAPFLPLLADWEAAKSAPRQVRIDFWDVFSRRYAANYFARIADRCARQGAELTGHLMGEEHLYQLLTFEAGDPTRLYRHFTAPGIDWIGAFGWEPGEEPSLRRLPSVTPRTAASSAAVHGRRRVAAEVFSGAGWGPSLADLREVLDWLFAHGVNLQVPIWLPYSLRGWNRTIFYPGGAGVQQPYWRHFAPFADYSARMSVLLSGGRPVHRVGLVFPSAPVWAGYFDAEHVEALNTGWNALMEGLLDAGVDPCVVGEDELGATLGFDVLVVPDGSGAEPVPTGPETVPVTLSDPESVTRVIASVAALAPGPARAEDGGPIRVHERAGDDFRLLSVYNPGAETRRFTVRGGDYELDPEDGRWLPGPGTSIEVEPGRMRILLSTDAGVRTAAPAPEPGETLAELTGWTTSLAPTMDDPDFAWQFTDVEADLRAPDGPGDWSEGALAHYSGEVRYTCEFEAPACSGPVLLDLGEVAVTARVVLNGVDLGVRVWAPYRFDVTAALKPGGNLLEVSVCNTLANHYSRFPLLDGASVVFGGTVRSRLRSGLIGPVRLTRGRS